MNSTRSDNKKALMIEALSKCLGIVTNAVKAVGISRKTHYEWIRNDPEYAEAVADLDNIVIDFVESKLYDLINQGETAATIFYLKTKARKRGYIERNEISLSDTFTITIGRDKT